MSQLSGFLCLRPSAFFLVQAALRRMLCWSKRQAPVWHRHWGGPGSASRVSLALDMQRGPQCSHSAGRVKAEWLSRAFAVHFSWTPSSLNFFKKTERAQISRLSLNPRHLDEEEELTGCLPGPLPDGSFLAAGLGFAQELRTHKASVSGFEGWV